MDTQKADAGIKQRRETQRERVTKAIAELPLAIRERPADIADAAIAAMPDPYIKKERNRPKLPTDDCVLCATRGEFTALVSFIEANADHITADGTMALARALREQGVV